MISAATSPAVRTERIVVAPPQRTTWQLRVKRCVQLGFTLCGLPRLVTYRIARAVLGRRAFSAASEAIARVPGMRGVYARQAFYRRTLDFCGGDIYFGWLSVFSMPEARVGHRVYIGQKCSIGFADIGDDAMLANGVEVLSGGREHVVGSEARSTMREQPQTFQRVRIGRGAWIGVNAVIMADVGEHAVVGAGAVVNRPIPPHSVAVGVPARVVRRLSELASE